MTAIMSDITDAVREHLIPALDWQDAHVGFEKAVDGLPADRRGLRPAGFEHSPWELVEHLRIALEDILDFCVNARYEHNLAWPDDYWPNEPAPQDDAAWMAGVAGYRRAIGGMARVAREIEDLTATVPTGKDGQTYLRALLLAVDHNAYHVGQIVSVRRALGVWP